MRMTEIDTDRRFGFGQNWKEFLGVIDEDRVAEAELSLRSMLRCETLEGLTFLDVGCGSGLFSLAAKRLGAKRIRSFDFDPMSVAATRALKDRFCANDREWEIGQGDILDEQFVERLGAWDIVYSWGVLHHTGSLWEAMGNATRLVCQGGILFLSIYRDQGLSSRYWLQVKRFYNTGRAARTIALALHIPYFVLRGLGADILFRRNPARRYAQYRKARGMSVTHDWVDWLGGYPFEVAAPDEVFAFLRDRGFVLENLVTRTTGWGCNEYVARKARSL